MTIIDETLTAKGFTPAPPGRTIEHIVIHHWGERGQTHDGVTAFFCTTGPGQTSAHYVVSDGRINCIVSDSDVAWHAGDWAENMRSIGIECRPEATDGDYTTIAELVRTLRERYGDDLPLHPHREFYNTACPGVYDLDRIDTLARQTEQEPDMPTADEIAHAVLTYQVPHKDPVTGHDDGQTTSLATMAGFFDYQNAATRRENQNPATIAAQLTAAGIGQAVLTELSTLLQKAAQS